ncbi:MAG: Carrier protein, partial [Pseudomonadota bacterium]|nr:Carrier protein [Pseudomonadota bacterium]
DKLPEYMLPKRVVYLESLPLTINGKLDRNNLPEIELGLMHEKDRYVAPRNNCEKKLCLVFADVLGLNENSISIKDDFFKLGGDSLLSIHLVNKIYHEFRLKISIKEIFINRTIAKLYTYVIQPLLDQNAINRVTDVNRGEAGVLTGNVSLLPIQTWFVNQVANGMIVNPNHWNQAFLIKTNSLNKKLLLCALNKLEEYHDALRLRYDISNGTYQQYYVAKTRSINLKYFNINKLNVSEEDHQNFSVALNKRLTNWQNKFVLGGGKPLYSVGYIDGFKDGSARIFCAFHHLIIDAVSWRILRDDLKTLYLYLEQHFSQSDKLSAAVNTPVEEILGAKGISYRQWVEIVAGLPKSHYKEHEYWDELLPGIDETNHRLNHLMVGKHHQNRNSRRLTAELTQMLLFKSNLAYNTESNDLILTVFVLALSKIIEKTTIYITLESHGREEIIPNIEIGRTVGWFTTMYPIRLSTTVKDDIGELVQIVKGTMRKIPNKGVGFGAFYGYGMLPLIGFNYLGQLAMMEQKNPSSPNAGEDWSLDIEGCGNVSSLQNVDANIINLTCFISRGHLCYNLASKLDHELHDQLDQLIMLYLDQVVKYTVYDKSSTTYALNDFVNGFEAYVEIKATTTHTSTNTGDDAAPNIFLLPPGDGGSESYLGTLVPHLSNFNLIVFNNYFLHAKRTFNISQQHNITYEFLAGFYIQYIKQIQPHGPYNFFGWSFGGVLAFEISRQLAKLGDRINLLIMLDAYFDYKQAVNKLNIKIEENDINYRYCLNKLESEMMFNKVLLLKANKLISSKELEINKNMDGELAIKDSLQISAYYSQTRDNNLSSIIPSSSFVLIPLNTNHVSWIKFPQVIENIISYIKQYI